MKWKYLFLFLFFQTLITKGQNIQSFKWNISLDIGIQEHDKRLFDYSEQASLLEKHQGFFGTYQLGLSISRIVFLRKKYELRIGGGISSEINTFTRPFDHLYGKNFSQIYILANTNRYYKNLLLFPIISKYAINKNFSIGAEVLPQFNFLTMAHHSNGSPVGNINWWKFAFHSLEVSPSIYWNSKKFIIGLKYRVFQLKEIDKILFNDIIKDPRTDQKYETFNPFKTWVSISVRI